MINEKKVKLMTRMASYEQKEGKEDLKIGSYYQKDYVSIHTVGSFIWATIGYVCLVALIALSSFDKLLGSMSMGFMITLFGVVVIGYLAVVIIYCVITHIIYKRKYQSARMRIKKYNHDLSRLLKLYEKENR